MKANYNGGYVGLIALLIVVAIMAFLMLKEYESVGLVPLEGSSATTTGSSSPAAVSPIQQAKNVKNLIETQDRGLLNQ